MFAESFLGFVVLLALHEARVPEPSHLPTRSLPIARYVPGPRPPIKKDLHSFGVETTARAALVMDVLSGELLYEKDAETAYPIASLTKLVTAMTFLDQHPSMETLVTIKKEDDPKEGKSVFPEGEQFSQGELLESLLIGSVNVAGNALARTYGSEETFVAAMNQKARKLGMTQALFFDPTGLNRKNQASAHDVAIALRAALGYPLIRKITKKDRREIHGRVTKSLYVIKNTNLLLGSFLNQGVYKIIAGKTGSLPEAGFCLGQATQDKQGHEIIVVILGSDDHFSRFQEVKALTAWTFQGFTWPSVP